MTTDIFDFWDNVRVRDGKHPADYEILSRVRHSFDLICLPAAFSGCLRTSPVVLLYLSPGLSEFDYTEADTTRLARHRRQWGGREPLPGPDDHERAWRWWKDRTKHFGDWTDLRTKVAILNICAYHAKRFRDWHLLAALPIEPGFARLGTARALSRSDSGKAHPRLSKIRPLLGTRRRGALRQGVVRRGAQQP
jgi:hypothetical protein